RDVEEPILEGMLTKLMSQVRSFEKTILNTHCPPYNTNIDLAPKLVDFKPVITSGGVVMEHVGCKSVRNIIERYQPLIGLHGHIHESRGVDKIGRTLVLNPGSDYNVGVLRAAYIVLEGSKVKSYLLVSG
ncbi:metallophosphoesterase family protein, partial [Thermogladius sp.]|uniref:metallophosphoesterase family protein n=1 Tax=Thermogladius sp. TaxID=2023064 RepID=UPI003D0D510E